MTETRVFTPAGEVRDGSVRIGLVPLIAVLPFMYYPRLIDGDTQLWVLFAAVFALCTFSVHPFVRKSDYLLIALSFLCVVMYAVRGGEGFELWRVIYTQLTFAVLWIVCQREKGQSFAIAIRATIVIWLAVGLIQYFAIRLALPIDMLGRFVEGRSGVPSLTPEPSVYGTLSVIHMMYLMDLGARRDRLYILAAAVSVVISGSVAAFLLLAFPFMKLNFWGKVAGFAGVAAVTILDFSFFSSGFIARIGGVLSGGGDVLRDVSVNLRVGHVYFTLWHNLANSLFATTPIDFMQQYNAFAATNGWEPTGSNYILSSIGDIVYGSGIAGVIFLVVLFDRIARMRSRLFDKLVQVGFVVVALLTPISISNAFLLIYATRRDGRT